MMDTDVEAYVEKVHGWLKDGFTLFVDSGVFDLVLVLMFVFLLLSYILEPLDEQE